MWALDAAGIRAVIAPSLGDIFHQNCFKVGVLPVILSSETGASLRRQLQANPGTALAVDLAAQTVTAPDGAVHRFERARIDVERGIGLEVRAPAEAGDLVASLFGTAA